MNMWGLTIFDALPGPDIFGETVLGKEEEGRAAFPGPLFSDRSSAWGAAGRVVPAFRDCVP